MAIYVYFGTIKFPSFGHQDLLLLETSFGNILVLSLFDHYCIGSTLEQLFVTVACI